MLDRLHDRDLARRACKVPHRRDRLLALGERDRHDTGSVGENGERLRLPEQFSEGTRLLLRRRKHGLHVADAIGEEQHASAAEGAGGQLSGEGRHVRGARRGIEWSRMAAKLSSRQGRQNVDFRYGLQERFVSRIPGLQPGAGAEGGEKQRKERRDGEAKPGLELFDLANRGMHPRSRYSENRTRARRYARGVRPRHAPSPLGSLIALCSEDPRSSRIAVSRIMGR
jgi:hypothetical protein